MPKPQAVVVIDDATLLAFVMRVGVDRVRRVCDQLDALALRALEVAETMPTKRRSQE